MQDASSKASLLAMHWTLSLLQQQHESSVDVQSSVQSNFGLHLLCDYSSFQFAVAVSCTQVQGFTLIHRAMQMLLVC